MRAAAITGLVFAVLAQLLAAILIGPGEGWYQPFYFSPALFILYPIVFIRLAAPEELPWAGLDVLLVAAAVILDWLLVKATVQEGIQYFDKVMALPPWPHLWLFLWLLWQGLALKLIAGWVLRRLR